MPCNVKICNWIYGDCNKQVLCLLAFNLPVWGMSQFWNSSKNYSISVLYSEDVITNLQTESVNTNETFQLHILANAIVNHQLTSPSSCRVCVCGAGRQPGGAGPSRATVGRLSWYVPPTCPCHSQPSVDGQWSVDWLTELLTKNLFYSTAVKGLNNLTFVLV